MELVVLWLALSAIVAILAANRGRSGIGWLLLAVIVSPLIAGLLVLVLPDRKADRYRQYEAENSRACPHCSEPIKRLALVCRYCGGAVEPIALKRAPAQSMRPVIVGIALVILLAAVAYFNAGSHQEAATGAAEPIALASPPVAASAPAKAAPSQNGTAASTKAAPPKSPPPPLRITPQ